MGIPGQIGTFPSASALALVMADLDGVDLETLTGADVFGMMAILLLMASDRHTVVTGMTGMDGIAGTVGMAGMRHADIGDIDPIAMPHLIAMAYAAMLTEESFAAQDPADR